MRFDNKESVQLLNTAIIKSKERKIDSSYEKRLAEICQSFAIEALGVAVSHLAETKKISRDQAAIQLVDTVRKLDVIWNDYVMMEGMERLKELLKNQTQH